MDRKTLFGAASLILCTLQYVPYYRGIFAGRVRPHVFTWLIWALIAGISFAAQLVKDGGPGAWASGYTMLLCVGVFALSVSWGEKKITPLDWLCLACSFLALAVWGWTHDPLGAVIIAVIADTIGFIPTIRKSISKPYEEEISAYAICLLKWAAAMAALSAFNVTTLLYPICSSLSTIMFIALVMVRRARLKEAGT